MYANTTEATAVTATTLTDSLSTIITNAAVGNIVRMGAVYATITAKSGTTDLTFSGGWFDMNGAASTPALGIYYIYTSPAADKYTALNLYRATSRGGTYSLQTTIPLVSSDTTYSFLDTTGLATSWYKVTFVGMSSTTESLISESEPLPAVRPQFTLKQLRQKVIQNLGGEIYDLTTATISAQQIIVPLLQDTVRDSNWYEGWHMFRPADGVTSEIDRRVSAYVPSTGTISHGGAAYTDIITTGEYLELLPVDIDFSTLNAKIGDGLQRCRYLYRFEFGATSGQRQYDLPEFIEGPEFVPDIWLRFGSTSGDYVWNLFNENGRWSKVRGTAFTTVLDINPSQGDNAVIALDVWRAGEILEGETDFTSVHPKWAEAACMVEVFNFLVDRDMLRHGVTTYIPLLQKWVTELRSRARLYGPTGGMRIQLPDPPKGFPSI